MTDWATSRKTPTSLSNLSKEEKKGIDALKQLVFEHRLPLVASLLSKDTLVNIGLSFIPSDGEFRYVSGSAFFVHVYSNLLSKFHRG